MKTKFRVLPRCFGIYHFGDKEILSAEIEEICVSTDTLSIEDYYECRSFALTLGLFYQDRILLELYQFLKNFGILPSEILPVLHKNRMSYSKGIRELYQSFDHDTKHELWDQKESVRELVKKDKNTIEKYAKGELGVNVLFKHRAIAALELIEDIHNAAFSAALDILKEKVPQEFDKAKPFLEELKIFSCLRKTNVFDYEQKFTHSFSYDFKRLVESHFKEYPIKIDYPIEIQFFADEKQKIMIKEKIEENGSDINGIGKILSKMLGNMLQRKLKFESTVIEESVLDNVEINTSPGEFV